jgi:drug/metabolite transporter (DMT)-like permease
MVVLERIHGMQSRSWTVPLTSRRTRARCAPLAVLCSVCFRCSREGGASTESRLPRKKPVVIVPMGSGPGRTRSIHIGSGIPWRWFRPEQGEPGKRARPLAAASTPLASAAAPQDATLVMFFLSMGVISRVANRIILVPLAMHIRFFSQATSVVQLMAYCSLAAWRSWQGHITSDMWQFVFANGGRFVVIGMCEGMFFPLMFSASSNLPGGLAQVLAQTVVPSTVVFSMVLLRRRYDLLQLVGLAVVFFGVLLASSAGGISSLTGQSGAVAHWNVLKCASAYVLLALALVLKDSVFEKFRAKALQRERAVTASELDVSVVSASATAGQLITQLLMSSVFTSSTIIAGGWQQEFILGARALTGASVHIIPWLALTYWMCNVAFSISALQLMRHASASTVVLANVAALPLSALVFCFCPLPLLHRQSFRWQFAASLLLVIVGNLIYSHKAFTREQGSRGAAGHCLAKCPSSDSEVGYASQLPRQDSVTEDVKHTCTLFAVTTGGADIKDGKYLYVIMVADPDYIRLIHEDDLTMGGVLAGHTSLVARGEFMKSLSRNWEEGDSVLRNMVFYAGELCYTPGVGVLSWNNRSGHYLPASSDHMKVKLDLDKFQCWDDDE